MGDRPGRVIAVCSVKGGVGKVYEYFGPGVKTLSVPERATITNMGAELGATSSVFPSDEATRKKILGAGLASSFGEAHYSLEADLPRLPFTLEEAARTPYRNDVFQPIYFVSRSLPEVADQLEALDVAQLRALAG